jgi:hypothetical protein
MPSRGTTFSVTLPLHFSTSLAFSVSPSREAARRSNRFAADDRLVFDALVAQHGLHGRGLFDLLTEDHWMRGRRD